MAPLVSVIMAVYNGERYLREAVDSILSQTFRDFEFIVINDGSSDATGAILSGYSDSRLRILDNERNLGLVASLNKGLAAAQGKYIARQDADDISLPERLERQVATLESQRDLLIIGGGALIIDAEGHPLREVSVYYRDFEIKWTLLWGNPFFHSASMFRAEAAKSLRGYSESEAYCVTEDYDFFSRLTFAGRAEIMRQVVIKWRDHAHSISQQRSGLQREQALAVSRENLGRVLGRPLEDLEWCAWHKFHLSTPGETVVFGATESRALAYLLLEIPRRFYRRPEFIGMDARAHRRRTLLLWARHALALVIRRQVATMKAAAALLQTSSALLRYACAN
ncbi:MAG: glycosyltransferase family 2 protein [Terriglobales bacterium]